MPDNSFSDPKASDHFSCCHRYRECSDAGRCVNSPNRAVNCGYNKNLLKGKIFYGKNADDFDPEQYAKVRALYAELSTPLRQKFKEFLHTYFRTCSYHFLVLSDLPLARALADTELMNSFDDPFAALDYRVRAAAGKNYHPYALNAAELHPVYPQLKGIVAQKNETAQAAAEASGTKPKITYFRTELKERFRDHDPDFPPSALSAICIWLMFPPALRRYLTELLHDEQEITI
jgi:hypothetical protein